MIIECGRIPNANNRTYGYAQSNRSGEARGKSRHTFRVQRVSGCPNHSLVAPIIQQFRDATVIEARVTYADHPQIAATLLDEGSNSPADVFFGQPPGVLP